MKRRGLTEDVALVGAELDEANVEALAHEERRYMCATTTPGVPRSF